ncbi:hypothetical protein EON66_04070 [archaeon]|nr:MAG: hypothetical protein EON66_04070 [archaeon]
MQAVESASVIIKRLSSAKVAEEVVPMIMKLSSGDWFTARVSACGLFAPAYERLEDAGSKAQLRMYVASAARLVLGQLLLRPRTEAQLLSRCVLAPYTAGSTRSCATTIRPWSSAQHPRILAYVSICAAVAISVPAAG